MVGVMMEVHPQLTQMAFQQAPMEVLAGKLSQELGATVVDKTGLKDNYDCILQWARENEDPNASESSVPAIQLGLKLQSQTGPVQILAIDHVEVQRRIRGETRP